MPNPMPVTEPVVRSRVLRGTSSAITRTARRLGYTGATPVCLTAQTRPARGFVSAIGSGQPDHRVAGAIR